jgi:thiamine biosynthesis lipoprotein
MHAQRRRAWPLAAALLSCLLLAAATALAGCAAGPPAPVRDSREALGTFVTITAYGGDRAAIERSVDEAFAAIAAVESELSAYPDLAADPATPAVPRTREVTSTAQFNLNPFEWHALPSRVLHVFDRVEVLGVGDAFSPTMLRVVQLYDFEGGGTVPGDAELARAVRAAQAFETRTASAALEGRFANTGVLLANPEPAYSSFAAPAAGLDFSGAAKGLALDAALAVMQAAAEKGALDGVLISAGSTTLVAGRKPTAKDAQPWHVGIEDPRDPQKIIGVVDYLPAETTATTGELPVGTVSTSGDYQQSFVRDGVRYHHILDPATGKPAREMRSLTVVGAATGIDSDILSTALFVMGVPRAEAYAREHGLGLFIVDAAGRTRIVPGPEGAPWKIRMGSN